MHKRKGMFDPTKAYSEILKLKMMLEKERIDFEFYRSHDGYQMKVYNNSIIEHCGSYGHEDNLIEVMGSCSSKDDDIEGYLTADVIFDRIMKMKHQFLKEHYDY